MITSPKAVLSMTQDLDSPMKSEEALFYMVYASTAVGSWSDTELEELLVQARRDNERLGVTGMLLYSEGSFIQFLEGEKKTVMMMYDKILKDPRHRNAIKLWKAPFHREIFRIGLWGFERSANLIVIKLSGYTNFLEKDFPVTEFQNNPTDICRAPAGALQISRFENCSP